VRSTVMAQDIDHRNCCAVFRTIAINDNRFVQRQLRCAFFQGAIWNPAGFRQNHRRCLGADFISHIDDENILVVVNQAFEFLRIDRVTHA